MEMKFVFLAMLLGVSLKAQSEMSALEMKLGNALRVQCEDSLPQLSGNVLTCEVICETEVVKTWEENQVCDQACWTEKHIKSIDVTVKKLPGKKLIFSASTTEAELAATLENAQIVAGGSCTKLQKIITTNK